MYLDKNEIKKAKTLYEKYKNQTVKFRDYWKYEFTYENDEVVITVGGNPDDIYRASYNAEQTVKSLRGQTDEEQFWIETKKTKETSDA